MGESKRVAMLERRLGNVVKWLEANQPDVFSRGLWDCLDLAAPAPETFTEGTVDGPLPDRFYVTDLSGEGYYVWSVDVPPGEVGLERWTKYRRAAPAPETGETLTVEEALAFAGYVGAFESPEKVRALFAEWMLSGGIAARPTTSRSMNRRITDE